MPEDDIKPLDPREHVRLRPGMYIGGTDARALHHLVFEIVDEVIEETLLGKCDHLWLTLLPDDVIVVRDNGRGLPVEMLDDGKRAFERIMTELGVRRKGSEYVFSGGMMMTVGLLAVNALAAECTVEVVRDGYLWRQCYKEGIPQTEVEQVRPMHDGEPTGNTITFRPDFTIMDQNPFSYETLAERAKELAYLLSGFTATLRDERETPARQDEFHYPNGLVNFVRDLNQGRTVLHEPLTGSAEWTIQPDHARDSYPIRVDVALQYADTMETTIVGYVNTLRTTGGWHMRIIRSLSNTVGNRERHMPTEEAMPGLTVVISVRHPHPLWESQAKQKISNYDVIPVVLAAMENARRQTTAEIAAAMLKLAEQRRALHADEPDLEDES